jgi:hypothetical protein
VAKNYAIKQDKMIEEQRLLCFEDMARLHRQVKERSIADTAQLAKDMQAIGSALIGKTNSSSSRMSTGCSWSQMRFLTLTMRCSS